MSAASGSTRGAASVGNASTSSPYSPSRPPPSTQPVSPGLSFGASNRLALLNKPGKGHPQSNGAGPSGSGGTGMPPPSQSATQMAKERVASSSSFSAQPAEPRPERDPFSVLKPMMRIQPIISGGISKEACNLSRVPMQEEYNTYKNDASVELE